MKNAFLILAHNEFEVLRRLVEALDDSRNDIYIHFDRKVDTIPDLNTEYAGLTILKHRVSVNWGAPSMLEAEYALFETAVARGSYQYYHLLSGVDLPIKSQDYIHGFLDRNDGKEFIGYTLLELTPSYVRKMQRWHLFPEDYKSRNIWSCCRGCAGCSRGVYKQGRTPEGSCDGYARVRYTQPAHGHMVG